MEEKEKEKSTPTILGCMSSLLIFSAFVGFSFFMFWVCMKVFGWEL
jgi:hypothetical protein